MVIGAFVRGLSMRDIEALCAEAGLGKPVQGDRVADLSRLARERYEHFKQRDLYDIQIVALFLDAVFLPVRPDGPKEGVLVAWGVHRERRTRPALSDVGDARVTRRLASPWP